MYVTSIFRVSHFQPSVPTTLTVIEESFGKYVIWMYNRWFPVKFLICIKLLYRNVVYDEDEEDGGCRFPEPFTVTAA